MSEEDWSRPAKQFKREMQRAHTEKATINVNPLNVADMHAPGHTKSCTCSDCMEMAEHVCTCPSCPKDKFAVLDRTGLGYYKAVRDWRLFAYKGQEKLLDVTEMNVTAGWAVRLSLPAHLCRSCYHEACRWIDYSKEFSVAMEYA